MEVAGAILAIILTLTLISIIAFTPQDLFTPHPREASLSTRGGISNHESSYLWGERILDTLFQAWVIFTALVCILALLRREGER